MLSECKDLDAYFQAYGDLLGARATKALAPLHVPGRDPDVEGIELVNDHVKLTRQSVLFGAQRDTLCGMVKAMRRQKSVVLAAEMGCIAGESEVYDPVAKAYRRVDQITEPFHVVSYHEGKAVIGKAHVPFWKGTRELYRVVLENGKSFIATGHHRLLTNKGWETVDKIAADMAPYAWFPQMLDETTGDFSDHLVRLTGIYYQRTDAYYDFTVDEYHNYVMAGVVHHNTGKSLMGCAAAHIHAAGKPYRGLVMCPDHLIKKWGREIERTCPGSSWRSFEDWREVLELVQSHTPPVGPEWWIIGRDQSKGDPAWETRVVKRLVWLDEMSIVRRLRAKGVPLKDLTREVAACPKCGTQIVDKDENPKGYDEVLASKKKLICKGQVSRYRTEGDDCKLDLIDCGEPLWAFTAARTKEERSARNSRRAASQLNASTAPYRWPAYRSIKGIMRRQLDYLILDEVHELKGADDVAQANAAGAFISRSKKVIALTGTLIGGYADHLFPILMRMDARSLVAAGFDWDEFGKFNARYGRVETQIHSRSGKTKDADYGQSNSHSKGSSNKTVKIRRPGIMPQLYGDHLIDKTCFLPLDQVSDGLPALTETIVPVDMDQEQEEAYRSLEGWLVATVKQMMAMGDKRLLATMLENLLYYPDHPFGWDAISTENDEFSPATLDSLVVRPKEEALIGLCHAEAAEGRQVWVYVQRVNNRDVAGRLAKLLADSGLRSGILRSSVSPREREEWIYKKGKDLDVCISHPDLVKTGLDLFAPDGNHNFPTLVFYQTGYNTFTMRQASRRSWRIGQKLTCKTVFIYYANTFQERCMTHMGKKMAACEAIDGKFSAEGLAAMAGEDDATMALAKALVDKVQMPAGVTWSKTLGFDKPVSAVPSQPVAAPATRNGLSFSAEELDILKRLHAMTVGA